MSKHTPGPWKAFLLVDEAEVIAPESKDVRIVDVFCGHSFTGMGDYEITKAECHANARLIAAAPALYEALKKAQPWIDWVADFINDSQSWNEYSAARIALLEAIIAVDGES